MYIMRKLLFLVTIVALIGGYLASAQQVPDVLKQIESSGKFAPMFPFQPTHNAPDCKR